MRKKKEWWGEGNRGDTPFKRRLNRVKYKIKILVAS